MTPNNSTTRKCFINNQFY